jgi:hypothetical protein
MTDIASSLGSQTGRNESSDSTILTVAGASLLAVFFLMVALLPFDVAHNPDYLSIVLGP